MPQHPHVSVILPTYNAASYLPSAINSVLAQSFTEFELLVLDNASSDNTEAVVRAIADPRIRYVRNAVNLGFRGNVEYGRTIADGAYVAIQNADDLWEPDHLARSVGFLDEYRSCGFVHARITLIDDAGQPYGEAVGPWNPVTVGRQAFLNCFRYGFSFPTLVIRNETLRDVPPLPEGEPWAPIVDTWLFLQLCLRGDAGFLALRLTRYRVHISGMLYQSYADGTFFRRRLVTTADAFAWPEVRNSFTARDQRRVMRQVARDATAILSVARSRATRAQTLRAFAEIASRVPSVLLHPESWARLAYSLLPRAGIQRLRQHKRQIWAARHAYPEDPSRSHG